MTKRVLVIDGSNFATSEDFYSEVDKKFTKNLNWNTGHNLDTFNDLLKGGFGVFEYEEPIKLIWQNSIKSKFNLNEKRDGKSLYDILTSIIKNHSHIEFIEN